MKLQDQLRLGGDLVSQHLQLHQPDGRIGHSHPIDTTRLAVGSRRTAWNAGRLKPARPGAGGYSNLSESIENSLKSAEMKEVMK
jgi:hypothetical protein